MSNILIRELDPAVLENIRATAERRGISVNRLVKDALEAQFSAPLTQSFHDLDSLAGTWSERDLEEFQEAIAPLERVDRKLWSKPRRRGK